MAGLFKKLLTEVSWESTVIRRKFEDTHQHDERAALICLLTAMFAQNGNAAIVGDDEGGWFWLPPLKIWDRWAVAALAEALKRASSKRFPSVRHWNGRGTIP